MNTTKCVALIILVNIVFLNVSSQIVQSQEIYNAIKSKIDKMACCLISKSSVNTGNVEKVTISDVTEVDNGIIVTGIIYQKYKEEIGITQRFLEGASGLFYRGKIKYEVKFKKILDAVTLQEIKAYRINYESNEWEIFDKDFSICLE